MKLKHAEIFHAVMLTGSASGAARLLHVTQPAATRALQLAELQLGYPLFTRQKNRLVPTAQALALYPEVQRLAAQLESVRRLAGALRADAGAPLRLLIVPSLATVQLPLALARFRRRHPKRALEIGTRHSREIVAALALKEADVGIVFGDLQPPGLEREPLATGRLVYVTRERAAGGRSSGASPIQLRDALARPLVRTDATDPLGRLLAEHLARHGLEPGEAQAEAAADLTVQTHHTALVLAEQGFGGALIDSFTAAARRDPALRVRPVEPALPIPLQALLPSGVRDAGATADLVAAFREAAQATAAGSAPG